MNNVERLFNNTMNEERFQRVVSDRFSFVDHFIEQRDLDKYKEGNNHASND